MIRGFQVLCPRCILCIKAIYLYGMKRTYYPPTGRFTTEAELDAYFSQDPLPCLICGKGCRALHRHVDMAHGVKPDEYRQMFNIPFERKLVCASLQKQQSIRMTGKKMRSFVFKEALKPEGGSGSGTSRRAIHFQPDLRGLESASKVGRERTLWREDYEEYLRRIETGRTISEVGEDGLMRRETFTAYCQRNPAFNLRLEKVLNNLPASVQVRGQRVGRKIKREMICLREEFEMSWNEIGEWFDVQPSTLRNMYYELKRDGLLEKYRMLPLIEE
jgi:hypothetical protein